MISASGQNVIEIGKRFFENQDLPTNTYSRCSLTQQIYTAEEIGTACYIDYISFDMEEGQSMPPHYPHTRYVSIYMKNTDRVSFASNTDWEQISTENLVYEGFMFYPPQWGLITIELDSTFLYDGTSNLLVCINDHTMGGDDQFNSYCYSYYGGNNSSIFVHDDWWYFDPYNTSDYNGQRSPMKNYIMLGTRPLPNNLQISPKQISMGYRPNGYWMCQHNINLKNLGLPITVTNIDAENDFFVLSGVDTPKTFLTGETACLSVGTGTSQDGEINTDLLISYDNSIVDTVSLSATVYTPVCPDVWELARNVVFNNNSYTDTPTDIYDNYTLPRRAIKDGPDAVYKLTFDRDVLLNARIIDGIDEKLALYKEDFGGYGGPCDFNSYSHGGDDGNITLTVCDGNETNEFVPVYGLWATAYEKCQYIIPASLLQGMNGYIINSMKFYSCSGDVSWGSSQWKVYMMETPNTTINQYIDENEATTVYEGILNIVNNEMIVDFTNGFVYTGGNLLVGFNNIMPSTYCRAYFYGETSDGACGQGYNSSSLSAVPFNQRSFLPKTTFSYFSSDMENAVVPAGTYYLAASSTTEGFSLEISNDSIPLPLAAYNLMPKNDSYQNADNVDLSWDFGKYTIQYQLLFDTVYPPQNVIVDWTDSLVNNHTLYDLPNLKRYYWQVNERNSSGVTYGEIMNFKKQIISPSADGIFYVDDDGVGDGSSWENAVCDLSYVLKTVDTMVQKPTIWVAAGTYYGDGIAANNAFTMSEGVNVYGGFAGDEPADFDLSQRNFEENKTVLNGQNVQRVLYQNSNFSATTVWDGFTINNGYTSDNGGGAYIRGGAVLRNCELVGSQANSGGGLYVDGNESKNALVDNCIISGNNANVYGGGIYAYYATMSGCVVNGNSCNYGGGMYCSYSSVSNCSVSNNRSNYYNALYLYSTTMSNCAVYNNESQSATVYGDGSNVKIINSTIANNKLNTTSTDVCCVGGSPMIANSIIWGNENSNGLRIAASTSSVVSHSAIEVGFEGEGNVILFSGNDSGLFCPRFENPTPAAGVMDSIGGCSWALLDGSVCVNRGDTTGIELPATDIAGNPRIQNGMVDMGCYESPYDLVEIPEYGPASLIGVVQINGVEQDSNYIEVAALCGDECRGIQMMTYYPEQNRYLLFLTIYGNDNDQITFGLYDHDQGQETEFACLTELTFITNETFGSITDPFVIEFGVLQETPMQTGWNWFASAVDIDSVAALEMLENSLGADGVMIKSQTEGFVMNYENYWVGNLNALSNNQMYMIRANAQTNATLKGCLTDIASHNITIYPDWTWLGYPNNNALNVNDALGGFDANDGDVLKTKQSFSIYMEGLGWIGSLQTLNPGQGLMYYSTRNVAVTLTYSDQGNRQELIPNITAENNHWIPNAFEYPDNMSMMAVVEIDGAEVVEENYELAASDGSKCVGSAKLMFVESISRYVSFLTISDEEGSELQFGLFDGSTGEELFNATDIVTFVPNAIMGSLDHPYVVSFRGMTGVCENYENPNIYPNPVSRATQFRIGIASSKANYMTVEIVDALGKTVSTNQSSNMPVTMTAPAVTGVYMIKIHVDGNETYCRKLIVK